MENDQHQKEQSDMFDLNNDALLGKTVECGPLSFKMEIKPASATMN
jgi:hypothetical protein